MSNTTTLLTEIIGGDHDDHLDRLYEAVRERQKLLRDQAGRTNKLILTPGTKVRLKDITPKYLVGTEGTVVADKRKRRGKARISVDVGRVIPGYGQVLAVPATCVEAI